MPITKSAIKKVRADKKKAEKNKSIRSKARTAVESFKSALSLEALSKAFSSLDRAAKKGVIKKRKADRIKSRLSKKVK